MRINIYSQEIDLDREPELVTKEGMNSEGEAETFYAVRFFLISPDVIHQTPTDDDQSAVTFWLPRNYDKRRTIAEHFYTMADIVRTC